jgi:hypothetical protein
MPTRPEPGLTPALRRRLRGAFTERLLYKGAAVFLALVLWLVVSTEQPTEDRFPVQLVLQRDSTIVLTEEPPPVTALVVGQLRDILRLGVTPPVLRIPVTDDGTDSMRVTLDPNDVQLPMSVDQRVDVRGLFPAHLTLRYTTRVERRVPVRSRIRATVDSGLRALGPARVVPDSVTIVGTREAVAAVTDVATIEGTVQVRDTLGVVVPIDTAGLDVMVQPGFVRVRVPVIRDALPLVPMLLPFGASGAGVPPTGPGSGGG